MRLKILLPFALITLFACTGNKFDYSTAYKFKVKTKSYSKLEKKIDNQIAQNESIPGKELSVSEKIEIVEEIEESVINEGFNPIATNLESKSKKQQRLEKRFEKVKKKIERRIEKKSSPKTIAINSKIYIGGVIFLGGLVLLILGGILGTIGSLAALVGVILVVWGLLEQA